MSELWTVDGEPDATLSPVEFFDHGAGAKDSTSLGVYVRTSLDNVMRERESESSRVLLA